MTGKTAIVLAVIAAADGQIVGRIRLQKIFYLLEQLGLESNFRFSYHHYGPYSSELSDALFQDAIQEEPEQGSFGNVYFTYSTEGDPPASNVGRISPAELQSTIRRMKCTSSVIIELAATMHWLIEKEKVGDWKTELKARKPGKATDERICQAKALLEDIRMQVRV